MKISTILTFFACFAFGVLSGQAIEKNKKQLFSSGENNSRTTVEFSYSLSVTSDVYNPLVNATSINNGEVWDDPEYIIPLGIPFTLNGNDITFLEFAGVGALLLSATANDDIETAVFPFENDLIDRGETSGVSQSPISYTVEGEPGTRIQKIEWSNAGSYLEYANGSQDMYINLQLWLYEGSNKIEFRFGDLLIDNPDLFYSGGTYMGVSDIDNLNEVVINGHFFTGDIAAPELSANDVTIEGTPAEGAVYTLSLTQLLEVTITSENSTSFCAPNGTATASVSGGIPPFAFLWSNGETSGTITNLDAGSYTVTVTDSDGMTGSATVEITNVEAIHPNATATSETSSDADDGTATSEPTGGSGAYTFLWNNGATTAEITDLPPGLYTVTVTDGEGCTAEQSVIVNAFECLTIEIVEFIEDASCYGSCDGFIQITEITGATDPLTYQWSTGAVSESIFDLCAGTYILTVVDAAGCEVVETYIVGEADEFFVNAGATSETGEDLDDGTAWSSPSSMFFPFTYSWSNGSTDSLLTNLSPGIYSVTVTDNNGCTAEESIEVFEFVCIGEVQFTVQHASCFGSCDGTISAIVNFGGVGPFTFLWGNGETTEEIVDLCSDFYSLTITDEGQGCELYGIALVDEPPFPVTITIDQIVHVTDSTTGAIDISTSGLQPSSTFWTGPNGFTSNEEDLTDLEAGIYVVVVTDGNGCTAMETIEIINTIVGLYVPYNLDVKIYPNPANENIYIVLDEEVADFKVQLINPDGRRLENWENVNTLDVSTYTSGMYYLRISSGDKYYVHRFNIIR